ncbi:uncharacterized protein LOC128624357 [Ictalurus furcatus]|uniref:uncharacterized protein LOC128624357 n=1 Tax=Ictalurus furcatus TaxID=66913 RepID=UPI00235012FF|nr:uncharacterized protein LOC128624357 [Ictalurus furcatus]
MGGTSQKLLYERHKPDIGAIVKQQCITWDTGNLTQVERYSIHAEKLLRDAKDRKTQKRGKDLHTGTLTMLQAANVQPQRIQQPGGRGRAVAWRGKPKGRGQGRPGGNPIDTTSHVLSVEKFGHFQRDCPEQKPTDGQRKGRVRHLGTEEHLAKEGHKASLSKLHYVQEEVRSLGFPAEKAVVTSRDLSRPEGCSIGKPKFDPFVDGSASRDPETGKNRVGYAVVTAHKTVCQEVFPQTFQHKQLNCMPS